MSEVTTPAASEGASTKEASNWEQVLPDDAGGAGGGGETGLSAGGASPGLDAEPPGQQAETPPTEQVEAPEQQATEPTQQQIPAKEDESRHEYWQSQAAKANKELDELKGGQLHAIARYIQKNPEMLDVVEDGMRGGQITRPKGIPERPVRPQKPDNYDLSEAHDPETVSGRFRGLYDEYLEKKDIYNDAREEQATVQAERNAGKAQLDELRSGLVREGGLSEFEANEFLDLLDGPQSRDPVTLAKFYRVLKAPSQDEIANKEKARQLLAKKNGLKAPTPLATAGGETPPQLTSEQQMAASITAHSRLGMKGKLL